MQDLDNRDFQSRYADGAQTRRELGAPLAPLDEVSDFSRPFRQIMGANLFNDIWNRPGLSRHDRCLIVIALLAANNRLPELRNYLGVSVHAGVTRDEIQEVLLQTVVYCGTLAGVGSFQTAEQFFAERDKAAGA